VDQAARREGAWLSARGVAVECSRTIARTRGPLLIEGAGGVMSPLNESETMLDLAAALGLPTVFVCGSYLGAISHALTGLYALSARGLTAALVLVNETPGSPVDLHETAGAVAGHAPHAAVMAIPRDAEGALWAEASRALGIGL
jgi:dethiobiotin synthetase